MQNIISIIKCKMLMKDYLVEPKENYSIEIYTYDKNDLNGFTTDEEKHLK